MITQIITMPSISSMMLPGLNIPASIIELIEGIVMICVIISYAVRYAMDVKKKKAMMRKAGV